ncbi:hypothetical protein HDV03_001759 [Kappamyces sp. JEL0829]|nr:hypothetical protein HDV03_001759 [Kappamyces sp. JEL0829]
MSKVALLIGATSGVGKAAATRFARQGVTVHLVGRSVERGEAVLKECREASALSHTFTSLDVTDLAKVAQFSKDFKSHNRQLNWLVLSAGGLTPGNRVEINGYEKTFLTGVYSKFVFMHHLLPIMNSGRVILVCSPGKGSMLDRQDFDLKKNFSFLNYMRVLPLYLDLMMDEFSRQHPECTFIHVFPGLLATRNKDEAPFLLKHIAMPLLYLFAPTGDAFGDKIIALATDPKYQGLVMVNEKLESVPKVADHTDDNRTRYWEFLTKTVCQPFL